MLLRFRPDDPAFLGQLETRLAAALRRAGSSEPGLLSITLAAPEIPFEHLPASLDNMFYWCRPAARHNLLGLGAAAVIEASGAERWRSLRDGFDAWRRHWQHEDGDATGLRPLALGGFSFAPRDLTTALPAARFAISALPAARLAIPALLLRRAGDITALTFTFSASSARPESARKYLRLLASALARHPSSAVEAQHLTRHACAPEDPVWLARVGEAVADIQSGQLDKVVLSRRVTVSAAQAFDPASIMAELARRNPRCTLFGLENGAAGTFLGASPELLAGLHNGEVCCDALAGTAWGEGSQDRGEALLGDVKNGREHRLVVQAVAEALRPMCARLEVPAAPVALQLGSLQHLRSTLRGKVKAGVGLLDLLERLHPTPAVGGYPRQAALDWLARHGEARDEWYTGAVGWMDAAGEGEFAVALRCARILGNEAELYAGAGIVAGSDPGRELAETEAKLAPMLHALSCGAGHGWSRHD